MRETVEKVIKENMALCFWDTSMALDIICEGLYYTHGIGAKWSGRSIYVGDERVASIVTCREGKNIVAICGYKIITERR
jgi:hypothetical protein